MGRHRPVRQARAGPRGAGAKTARRTRVQPNNSQIPPLLFAPELRQAARQHLRGAQDVKKQRLLSAVDQIAPVRNEIAHVREVRSRPPPSREGRMC